MRVRKQLPELLHVHDGMASMTPSRRVTAAVPFLLAIAYQRTIIHSMRIKFAFNSLSAMQACLPGNRTAK